MTVTDLTKVAVSEQPHSPKKDSPDTDQTFSFIEPCLATHSSNYMDCTESNDDDDDDDDDDNDKDDTEQPPIPHPSDVAPPCHRNAILKTDSIRPIPIQNSSALLAKVLQGGTSVDG